MEATMIRLLFLISLAAVVSGRCVIDDQPFMKDVALGRLMGRWYTAERLTTFTTEWHGHILDFYEENGVMFLNMTYLAFNAKCDRTRQYEVRISYENRTEMALYSNGKQVVALFTPGASYDGYLILYYCPMSGMTEGMCTKPIIETVSREKEMSDADFAAATELRDSLCQPSAVYTYTPATYNKCLKNSVPNEDACDEKFIPYLSTFDPLKVMGRWYLKTWFFPEGEVPSANIIGLAVDVDRKGSNYNVQYYYTEGQGCSKLPIAILKSTPTYGKLMQLGEFGNGTRGFVYDTDYTNWLIFWSCQEPFEGICEKPLVEIWSRSPFLSPVIKMKAKHALKDLCGPTDEFSFPSGIYEHCPEPEEEKKDTSGACWATSIGLAQVIALTTYAVYRVW